MCQNGVGWEVPIFRHLEQLFMFEDKTLNKIVNKRSLETTLKKTKNQTHFSDIQQYPHQMNHEQFAIPNY